MLAGLDVPYLAAQPVEFQTLEQWESSDRGLLPVEATMMVALPELDGATGSMVFGGRSAGSRSGDAVARDMQCAPRARRCAGRPRRQAGRRCAARRAPSARSRLVLFNFPPNAGTTGTAAYLARLRLPAQHAEGAGRPPATRSRSRPTVDALRERIIDGNAARFGAHANVHARIPADDHVRRERWLAEIEAQWGPAPGRQQSDGGSIFVLGAQFGNVLRRRAARLRLRGRPDAAAVREGLRADPRLLRLLPLAARGFRRPRRAAFRHARRARVHARQAVRAVGRLLARPADRRPAQHLSLCRQQPVRGHASPSAARRRR